MYGGYYSSVGGMVTQFNRLDTISNNIANANTTGFKRDDVVIGDFLRIYQEKRDELPLENHTKEAAQFVNRSIDRVPQIVEQYTDFQAGGFEKTDNNLDMALKQNNRFFAVLTPAGVRYTRDGAFNLDDQGRLVTKDGFPVLPREYFENGQFIELPQNQNISFDQNGNIYAKGLDLGDIDSAVVGNVGIFGFENVDYLKKEGSNFYKALREDDRITYEESGSLLHGFLEKSNINLVKEMTSLIEANRLVEYYSKAMKTQQDDLNSAAINKLGNVKG
ncbi:MAG: flagellar hook-basal body protein [Campylobacterales bacterium]